MYEEQKPKTFLEELQSLDEPIKRRALVVASGVIMVIVVFVWLGYFNSVVIGGQQQAQVAENNSAASAAPDQMQTPTQAAAPLQAAEPAGPSMWQNMEGGMASIYRSFGGMIDAIAQIFQAPRQYNIQPQR